MRTVLTSACVLALVACGGGDDTGSDATFVAWGSSTSTITLAWEPVAGATGYQLERVGSASVALDAAAVTYLDRDLAAGTYAYHLTAIGVDAPAQDTSATTSADAAVITLDDAPIGDPVVATIGSAGGTIELLDGSARAIVPAGALPDGATVTLQQITPPVDGPDLAVEVATEPEATAPIEISFALDDDDRADLANVGIAVKQPDGMWVTAAAARVEGDRAIIATTPVVDALWAAGRGRTRAVRLRRIRIQPELIYVRANTEVTIFARAIFSDDICQEEYVVWLCRGFDVPRDDALMPIASPIVDPRPIRNSDGSWSLDGPGTLLVEGVEHAVTYQAPSSMPNPAYWTITFTHRNGMSSHGLIRFIDSQFNIKFVFHGDTQVLGYYLEGTVDDEFRILAVLEADHSMTVLSGPYNQPCGTSNTYPVAPATAATAADSPRFELFTAGSGAILDNLNGNFTGIFPGTTQEATTTVTIAGSSTTYPAGPAADIALTFFVNGIDFAAITTERSFPLTGTDWTMIVSPAVGPQ